MNQTKKRTCLEFAVLPAGTAQKKLKQRIHTSLITRK